MAKCLVTGGCGFIGRHLVQALCKRGHDVAVIDIDVSRADELPIPRGRIVHRDIVRMGALPFGVPDVVFHLAAVSRTVPACADPYQCIRTNVLGTARVLETCRNAGVPRVVVSSSNVVLAGMTPYRDSKRAVEDICLTYAGFYKQSVIALRYSNVYGPGIPQGDPAVFAMLRESFLKQGYAEVTGDGEQARDFTHVSDIVFGNIVAWGSRHTGVVDLCTGRQTTINAACKMLKIPVQYIAERPGDAKQMYQNPAPASNILAWAPQVTIEEGIRDIWN